VAEHTIALILALNCKIHRAHNRVREMNFSLSGLVGFDLFGKTAGVLGTGKIGRIVAEILRGFGMRVLAFDAYPNQEWATQNGIEYVEPRTPETDRIVNKDTLALTKPGVNLINDKENFAHYSELYSGLTKTP